MNVADRIDFLFKICVKDDGSAYSYREIEKMADGAISSTAVWKLHTGRIRNPSLKALSGLSKAFGISADYFIDENVTPENVQQKIAHYRDEVLVDQIAKRTSQLDERARQDILDMIEYVRKAQELDKLEETDERDD